MQKKFFAYIGLQLALTAFVSYQDRRPPHFGGLVPLLLTTHITNMQHNYYFFNQ